jgi:hypothetical protein
MQRPHRADTRRRSGATSMLDARATRGYGRARMASMPPPPGSPDRNAPTPFPPAGAAAGTFGSMPPPPTQRPPATSGGPVRLEPMGAGQTIDAAIKLFRAQWKTLMAIVGVISVPFTVFQAYVIHATTHPVYIGGGLYASHSSGGVVLLLSAVSYLVIAPLLRASMIRALAGIYLGERPGAGSSIRFGFSKVGWVLLAILLSSLLAGLGLIALVIPGIILYVRYSFAVPAVVVEGQRGSALGRSWRLSKGLGWHIFGTLLLSFIISAIISTIISVPSLIVTANETFNGTVSSTAWVVRAIFGSISTLVVAPFTSAVGVLLYFDARIRKEGFDLAVMAREVGTAAS